MANQQGIYNKYRVKKTDGSPMDPEARYFVLRPNLDPAARVAMRAYADATENEDLARDIFAWMDELDSESE